MNAMSGHEKKFWESIRALGNTVRLPAGDELVPGHDTSLYLFDTSDGSMMYCRLRSEDMKDSSAEMKASPESNARKLEALVELDAKKQRLYQPSMAEEERQKFLTASTTFLCNTRMFDKVVSAFKDDLGGHWLILFYRFVEDGRLALRPAYQHGNKDRFLTVEELLIWVSQVVGQDMAPGNPLLAGMINDSGYPSVMSSLFPNRP